LPVISPNQIDDAEVFVRQHYQDFLTRDPDPAGLSFWTNQITECQQPGATCNPDVRRINVSAAFFLSIEFQETGYLAYRVYKEAFGNLPGKPVPIRLNDFLADTQQLSSGVVVGVPGWDQVLARNKQLFSEAFVARAPFVSEYPTSATPNEFVDTLYLHAGVTPSAAERAAAVAEFGAAAESSNRPARARVLLRVAANSTFIQQEKNPAFVLVQYFGYLRRNPDEFPELNLDFSGYGFWLGKLNQFNGNFIEAEMVKSFIISGEYRQRFGP
jgi:hypothetical protein